MPRHPPCALYSLTFSLVFFKNYMSKSFVLLAKLFTLYRKNHFLCITSCYSFFELFSFQGAIFAALRCYGGDEESRTPDPLLARQVLSQLSYTPIFRFSVRLLLPRPPFALP